MISVKISKYKILPSKSSATLFWKDSFTKQPFPVRMSKVRNCEDKIVSDTWWFVILEDFYRWWLGDLWEDWGRMISVESNWWLPTIKMLTRLECQKFDDERSSFQSGKFPETPPFPSMSLLDLWHPICPKFQNPVEPMVDNSSRSPDAIFGWEICVITLNNEMTDLQNFWLRWTSCRFRLLVLQYPENRRRLTSPFAGKRGMFVWVAQ